MPEWIWGLLGGLALGPVGLVILWPACSRGASVLMKRFVISVLVKLALAGVGIYLALKYCHLSVEPIIIGFMAGYCISLFLEITLCLRKVRKCA